MYVDVSVSPIHVWYFVHEFSNVVIAKNVFSAYVGTAQQLVAFLNAFQRILQEFWLNMLDDPLSSCYRHFFLYLSFTAPHAKKCERFLRKWFFYFFDILTESHTKDIMLA